MQKQIDHGRARAVGKGFLVKLALMAIIDALGVYGIWAAYLVEAWTIIVVMVIGLAILNYIYFTRKHIPAKYFAPGMAFLLVYQIFVMGYTGYIAFTNYGTGHQNTKEVAIAQNLAQNEFRVEGAQALPVQVVELNGQVGLAVIQEDGTVTVGTAEKPMTEASGAVVENGVITSITGYTVYPKNDFGGHIQEIPDLRVPVSDDPNEGFFKTEDGSFAYRAESRLTYDESTDTIIEKSLPDDKEGADKKAPKVYKDNGYGSFATDDGEELPVGWQVVVGADNFKEMVTGKGIAGPFLKSLIWTFVFALLSVLTTFAFGLFLAIVFNDERIRGRKIYRSLLILPYAFPGFLSALVWRGMMNTDFGFINEVLLFGTHIPWLQDPWLGKLSILFVNLWLGFPYMFLICTGALQSLPGDVMEAARIDGASAWVQFKTITLPLVLVSTAPLLIASFAFNFNNFSLIYMLTGGGPNIPGNPYGLGETDILISLVYALSMTPGAERYGLAAAMSIVIFVIVGLISWLGFRQTKKLEELM